MHGFDLVAVDPVNEVLVEAALYDGGRYHQRIFVQGCLNFYRHQQARPELLPGVVEFGLGADGAGVGVDLVVDQGQVTFAEQVAGFAVGVGADVGLDLCALRVVDQALQGRQHLLWQGELDGNRVDLGHGEQALGVGHAQEVAFIDCANTDAAGDRGANLRVGKLYLRGINRGLVALGGGFQLVDQGLLLVVGLLGNAVIDAEQFVAFEVDLGDLQLRLAFAELGAGLVEAGADRAVVDGGEQVACFDQLTFLDEDFGEDAVDLGAYDHAVQGQHRADAAGVAGDVFFADGDHSHRDGGRGGEFGGAGRVANHRPAAARAINRVASRALCFWIRMLFGRRGLEFGQIG